MPTCLSEEVGLPRTPALIVVLAVMAILLGLITFVARLSDRIGRKPILSFRYGSLAIAFNVSVSLFGGTTPLVAAALVSITGSNLAPALLLIVAGVIGIVSVYFSEETARRPLPGAEPSAASEAEAREVDSERRRRDEE